MFGLSGRHGFYSPAFHTYAIFRLPLDRRMRARTKILSDVEREEDFKRHVRPIATLLNESARDVAKFRTKVSNEERSGNEGEIISWQLT